MEPFLPQCTSTFPKRYRDWSKRISQHNTAIRQRRVNDHLQEVLASEASESIETFAKHVHIGEEWLRLESRDNLQRLIEHNRAVTRQQSSAKLEQILHAQEQCAAARQSEARLLRSENEKAFVAILTQIEGLQETRTLKEFAAEAGITYMQLHEQYPEWQQRLESHNQAVTTAPLKAAWERMELSGEVWSVSRFASEVGLSHQVLRRRHPDLVRRLQAERLLMKSPSAAERIHEVVCQALRLPTLMSPTQVAEQAKVTYTTLFRHYPEEYKRIVEHAQTLFRTPVEATWHQVCTSGECPTISEFAARCGLPHFSHLLAYFPDIAEQVRTLAKRRSP